MGFCGQGRLKNGECQQGAASISSLPTGDGGKFFNMNCTFKINNRDNNFEQFDGGRNGRKIANDNNVASGQLRRATRFDNARGIKGRKHSNWSPFSAYNRSPHIIELIS